LAHKPCCKFSRYGAKKFTKKRGGLRPLFLCRYREGPECKTVLICEPFSGLLHCHAGYITGVELDENAHTAAVENIRRNHLSDRMESICGDLRQLPKDFTGRFDCCVSNPPYFSGGPAASRTPLARREDCCSPSDLFSAAAAALKYGGDFFLVHKPERLAELIARGSEVQMEAKRLLLLRHRTDGPITLICLQFRKGGKPGLIIEEAALFDTNNEPTPYRRSVYHS
jgi:tRNA1(Val) A37 N6-methylase TrmN6